MALAMHSHSQIQNLRAKFRSTTFTHPNLDTRNQTSDSHCQTQVQPRSHRNPVHSAQGFRPAVCPAVCLPCAPGPPATILSSPFFLAHPAQPCLFHILFPSCPTIFIEYFISFPFLSGPPCPTIFISHLIYLLSFWPALPDHFCLIFNIISFFIWPAVSDHIYFISLISISSFYLACLALPDLEAPGAPALTCRTLKRLRSISPSSCPVPCLTCSSAMTSSCCRIVSSAPASFSHASSRSSLSCASCACRRASVLELSALLARTEDSSMASFSTVCRGVGGSVTISWLVVDWLVGGVGGDQLVG